MSIEVKNCLRCGKPVTVISYNHFAACSCGYMNPVSQLSQGRKPWDKYFMDIAFTASTRATCSRRHVGAVLTKDKKVLGTGYNGAPSGVPSCLEEGCLIHKYIELNEKGEPEEKHKCIRTIHAEQNLILFTDQNDRNGATLYVTDQPCWTCANIIANSGIVEVVYHRGYEKDHVTVLDLFTKKNITLTELKDYQPPIGFRTVVIE